MSHLKERKEKNCLNCNAEVQGKFCHICGQENIEPEETAWHLVTHFFNDITHFDGKFFSTLRYLILKPGFLSSEYKAGRRASYLNPIRMYVFTSAIFFLVFFSVSHVEENILNRSFNGKTEGEIRKMDPADFKEFTSEINAGKPMTKDEVIKFIDSTYKESGIHFTNARYKNKAAYDSVLKSGNKDHNWIQKKLIYREIEMNEKYHNDQQQITKAYVNNLLHTFPQLLFISLPLFALILRLLYFRRKHFYYASHAIFSIHFYVFVFIMMLISLGLSQLHDYLHWNILYYIIGAIMLFILIYLYKAMRNFYGQRRGKTILKYSLLSMLSFTLFIILFLFFLFFSLLKI